MANPDRSNEKKCAHPKCSCMVEGQRRYCSDDCEDLHDSSPTAPCTCDHPGCKGV